MSLTNDRTIVAEDIELPSDHDLAILKAFSDDQEAKDLSFQGIKRKLGLHQETLSRALHRLQRDGFVERLEHAYRISPKGMTTISRGTFSQNQFHNSPEAIDPYSVSLLQAKLPLDVNLEDLVESMSFKWFGNLRWLGSSLAPSSAILSWITSDTGLKISVRIKDDLLTIETSPTSADSISEATRSAFELFDHVSKALKGSSRSAGAQVAGKAA